MSVVALRGMLHVEVQGGGWRGLRAGSGRDRRGPSETPRMAC
jgi:hypothetical protein